MRFAVTCDGEKRTIVVRGTISADVVVATENIRAGQPIDAAALTLERRDVTTAPGALASFDDVVGKTSRRTLRAGQLLDRRWLNESVLVKRNSQVTIVARSTGVEVHVPAEALQAGRRGEVISVKNSRNGTIIRARVIAESTVEPVEVSPEGTP